MADPAAQWEDDGPRRGDEALAVKFSIRPRRDDLLSDGSGQAGTHFNMKMADRLRRAQKDLPAITVRHEGDVVDLNEPGKEAEWKKLAIRESLVLVEGAGRPIFHDTEYIEIRIPGDKYTIIETPVNDRHRRRFAERYRRWKDGSTATAIGMPLAEWPGCLRSDVEELKHWHISTVEQLAAVPDGNLKEMGPRMGSLKARAAAYLDAASGGVASQRLQAEIEKRDEDMRSMRAQLADLTAAMAARSAPEGALVRGTAPEGAPPEVTIMKPKRGGA